MNEMPDCCFDILNCLKCFFLLLYYYSIISIYYVSLVSSPIHVLNRSCKSTFAQGTSSIADTRQDVYYCGKYVLGW